MEIFYVGIDWGSENHAVCVTCAGGKVRVERMLRNDGAFVRHLVEMVGGDLTATSIAIESSDLPIVDMLVEAGCAVFTINPKQAERFRDRMTAGGAKDDRRDARALASALRTDQAAFRRVASEAASQALLRLRARAVLDAEAQFRAAANQLRAVLSRYFPALLELCSGSDERWLWRLLTRCATPDAAAKLTTKALQTLLHACRVRRIDAAALQAVLRAPHLRASRGVERGCVEDVGRLVEQLELLHAQKTHAAKLRDEAVERLRDEQKTSSPTADVELVASMPGAGPMVVAALFGEAEAALRSRDLGALRAAAGVAPITKRSGKSCVVMMRRARNLILANALFHAARVAAMNDERWKTLLASLRARGQSYGRALRGVADRYLDVLFAVLRSGTPYDPGRARGSAAPAAT